MNNEKSLIIVNHNFSIFGGAEKASFQIANIELYKNKKVYFCEENQYSNNQIIIDKVKDFKFNKLDYQINENNIIYLNLTYDKLIDYSIKNNLIILFNNSYLWKKQLITELKTKKPHFGIFTHCHVGWLNKHILELKDYTSFIIGVNDITNETLLNFGYNNINFIKLNHYIEPENNLPIDIINNEINIAFIGRIDIEKGIHFLPYICNKLNNNNIKFKLHIIGDGPKKEELENQFLNNNLIDKVIFYGYQKEPKHILAKCHLLLFPSISSEGLPYSILEALSLGICCICTNTPSIGPLVNFEKNTLINLNSYNELHKDKLIYFDYNEMFKKSLDDIENYSNDVVNSIINIVETNQYKVNFFKRKDFIKNNFNLENYIDNVNKLFIKL